jgi:OmpA-OmpF porin, OOP family
MNSSAGDSRFATWSVMMFESDTARAAQPNKQLLPGQTRALLLALTLSCSVSVTRADDSPAPTVTYRPDYVSVLPGYALPSKAYETTGSGFTISGIYGYQFEPHWSLEANVQGSVFETGLDKGTDFYQNGFTGDLVYLFRDRHIGLFTPFALVGAGAVYDDFWPHTRAGTAFIGDGGLGLVTQPLFANGLRLRIDARYVYDTHLGGHGGERVLAGIDIPLGRIEHQVIYLPGKPEIREVVREVIKEVPRPWKDSDGDGVDDDHDLCPDTPKGLRVDAHGCVIEDQTVALNGVTFDFNKARLTPNAMVILDGTARAFIGQPSLKAEVAGHTDSIGSAAANQKLSQLRAEAVRNYLIAKGVRTQQLSAKGYGKSQMLINPESGEQDRERNRRVELRVELH